MYAIGVDLGGTNIAAGIINKKGELMIKDSTPTLKGRNIRLIIEDMATLCKKIIQESGLNQKEIGSVGIGSPGIICPPTGTLVFSNNLQTRLAPLASQLEELLDKPVFLENDANCAALGEALYGNAKGYPTSITVTLGTGIGSGVIIDGKIYSGAFYGGGESGHMVIVCNGRKCSCGRKGCWEMYASGSALLEAAKKQAAKHPDSLLNQFGKENHRKISAKTAFDAALAGDLYAKQIVEDYYHYLACGIGNLINIFQPHIICIGGGLSAQGDTMIQRLNQHIKKEIYGLSYTSEFTKLSLASLGNDAGILGAAVMGKLSLEGR